MAIVQAPRSLPRIVVPLPGEGAHRDCVLLSSDHRRPSSHKLFTGMQGDRLLPVPPVTRNSDLFVDEEEIDDLRRALEGELAHRRYGAAVRLETSSELPARTWSQFLQAAVRVQRPRRTATPWQVRSI